MTVSAGLIAAVLLISLLLTMVGLFYLLSGVYYRIPVPVEPMKVIGAHAVATGLLLMAEGVRFMIGTSTFQKLQEAAGLITGIIVAWTLQSEKLSV